MVFEGFVVPDPVVSGAVLGAVLTVVVLLYLARPTASQWVVLAFVPWMVLGALLHVLYQMHLILGTVLPEQGAVLFSAPTVYLTTFVLMGLVWVIASMVAADSPDTRAVAWILAGVGTLAGVPVLGYAALEATQTFAVEPILPLAGLLVSLALTPPAYLALGMWRPDILVKTRYAGALVLFAHVFDAVTTAIGVEFLGVAERSTLPRVLFDVAAGLPTADLLGETWLFVVVKILLASAIVASLHGYADDRPGEANLFLAGIAAVGLGPGAHNFFLFVFGI